MLKRHFKIWLSLFWIFITFSGLSLAEEPIPLLLKRLTDYRPPLTTTVYAKDGSILAYFYRENRFLVSVETLPVYLKQAFIAAEDGAFYTHDGVDPHAIFRAFSNNIKSEAWHQGGSTITQQVIKGRLLSGDKSFKRKIKEAVLASHLEKFLSKDQILTIYLNDIYLGAGAYGVEAAARTYFNKPASSLSLAESALLAGLPKAPSQLNPFYAPAKAKKRQQYVLERMLADNFITPDQFEQAVAEPLTYQRMHDPSWERGPYYLAEVRRRMLDLLSREKLTAKGVSLPLYGADALYEGGLHIFTSFDQDHQQAAREALTNGLEQLSLGRKHRLPLNRIDLADADRFMATQAQNKSSVQDFRNREWVTALVVDCGADSARVRVGPYHGTIKRIDGIWRRDPAFPLFRNTRSGEAAGFRELLAPGDVVETRILAVSDKGLELELVPKPRIQGALVSMDPRTGEVKALVGGYDYQSSQFNRATQARRQPGSLFKPVVFSTALAHGYTAASLIMDEPFTLTLPASDKPWEPKNFSGKFQGPTLLGTAMIRSMNVVTARVAHEIGIPNVIRQAHQMGFKSGLPQVPSVCLGAGETTLMEMVQVYSTFARNGTHIEPRLVLSVYDREVNLIFRNTPQTASAMSPQDAYIITHLLQQTVENGTGQRAKALNQPVAGKTGTSNDMRDAWFMGFTPYLLTGVFVGFDDSSPMGRQGTGARSAAPIWVDYHQKVKKHYKEQAFEIPPDIFFGSVSPDGYYLGEGWRDNGMVLAFKKGTQPKMPESGGPLLLYSKKELPVTGAAEDLRILDINESRF